jgi:hypothetical protein
MSLNVDLMRMYRSTFYYGGGAWLREWPHSGRRVGDGRERQTREKTEGSAEDQAHDSYGGSEKGWGVCHPHIPDRKRNDFSNGGCSPEVGQSFGRESELVPG